MMVLVLIVIVIGVTAYLLWEVGNFRRVNDARPGWRRWLRVGVAIIISFVLLQHANILYCVISFKDKNPSTTALMEQRAREAEAQGLPLKRELIWVDYEHISGNLVRAIIAGEDPRFLSHSGVDWKEILRAIEMGLSEGRVVRGGSTISQQLVKNLFLSTSKNPLRKLHELIIVQELEITLSKRRIIELYLNLIEWGDGIYGIEAAARHYFNTPASSLTMEQAAFLTVLLPAPRAKYDLQNLSTRTRDQIQVVLENMRNVVLPAELAAQN